MTEHKPADEARNFVPDDPRIPLVIGVTGHRDLRNEDRSHLEHSVHRVLARLRSDHPHTPLLLLSGLAEGADQLVARVGLSPDIAAHLIVPLPLSRDLYEDDFETPHSRAEFKALLDQSDEWFDLPLAPGNTEENIRARGPHRDAQYAELGKYIARESHILIALWDGVETQLAGGTAQVVRFQLEGLKEPGQGVLDEAEPFPVYQIVTPRTCNPAPCGDPFSLRRLFPGAFLGDSVWGERYYRRIFEHIEAFNRNVASTGPRLQKEQEKSRAELLHGATVTWLPAELGVVLKRYAMADALAISFQRCTSRIQRELHIGAFFAFLFFVLSVHLPGRLFSSLPGHKTWLVAAALALSAAMYLRLRRARSNELDIKHQDYRALAEGLRVKFFWGLAAVPDSVAGHYLGNQRTELDWIRSGLRGWEAAAGARGPAAGAGLSARESVELTRKYWVEQQRRYFDKAVRQNKRKHQYWNRWARRCIVAAMALIAALLVLFLLWGPGADQHELWVGGLAVLTEAALALSAIVHHYNERMAYAEHAKQYSRMDKIFRRAQRLVSWAMEDQNYHRAITAIRDLGREALLENGEWVLLHRERPLELPHP
jgi:hypothetical protein